LTARDSKLLARLAECRDLNRVVVLWQRRDTRSVETSLKMLIVMTQEWQAGLGMGFEVAAVRRPECYAVVD
jgi:hypothetical protein